MTWYVLARRDNGYPVLVYADEQRARFIAEKNNMKLVPVRPVGEELNKLGRLSSSGAYLDYAHKRSPL